MQTIQEQGHSKTSLGYYHPGLKTISSEIAALPRARVLDLGAPSAASFKYFKRHNCHIRFENLHDFMATAIADKTTWDSDALVSALDRYLLLLKPEDQFDVILAWDIFCYLDPVSIDYLSHRLARHTAVGAKLHMVRYWGNVYPRIPCEYYMVDECHVVNNFEQSEKRHLQKLPPVKTLQTFMSGFKLSEFHISEDGMHPAITDAVFESLRENKNSHTPGAQKLNHMRSVAEPVKYSKSRLRDVVNIHVETASSGRSVNKFYGHHKSPALDGLLSLRLHQNARVLDLGANNKVNERTYRRYTPHIHFADLPAVMASQRFSQSQLLGKKLSAPVSQLRASNLAISQHWKFDLIMGWDVLSRYSHDAISQVMNLIKPHVHANTYMHLLQYVGDDQEHILDGCNLLTEEDIELIKGSDGVLHHRHTIFELITAMGYGSIEQSFVFAKGMHENYHEYVVALNAR